MNIHLLNSGAWLDAIEQVKCGKAYIPQISNKDFQVKPEITQPLKEYKPPEGFPDCCEHHKDLVRFAKEKYEEFPNCCDDHRKLNGMTWFTKEDYADLPERLLNTLSYTWHCISNCIENSNWYKEITDYMQYTINSYGQFPDKFGSPLGLGTYLDCIKGYIEQADITTVPIQKKQRLFKFISDQYRSEEKSAEPTDINLLIGKYKEWMKLFPFEISFFNHLKPYFERQMPIFSSKGERNIYTGTVSYTLITKGELISALKSTTLFLLKELNSYKQYQKSPFTDTQERQLEITLANRRIEIEELDQSNWGDRKEYIKVLKKWLNGEKKFLKEISKLFKDKKSEINFINDLIDAMKCLQKNDTNEPCINNIKENKPDKETAFRYWFKNFFSARYKDAHITAEEEKGNGRIDLKIILKQFGEKIIEFKGWWNEDKKNSPNQICSYLTDFEDEGYIFMINHLVKKDITSDYKELITVPSVNYIPDSWKEHPIENSKMVYYESRHKFAVREKILYHFIFNVYSSQQQSRQSKQ